MMPDLDFAIDGVELPYDRAILCFCRPRPHLDGEQGKPGNPKEKSSVPHGLALLALTVPSICTVGAIIFLLSAKHGIHQSDPARPPL